MASDTPTIDISNSNNGDGESLSGVPLTSLYTAVARAKESALPQEQRRFHDPYASKLIQPVMKKLMEEGMITKDGNDRSAMRALWLGYVRDRTVYFDEAIRKYLLEHPNCKQIVLLGSGMDTRAYRMDLSPDITVFEIDYAHVQDYKTNILKGDKPSCRLGVIKADMTTDDWPALLTLPHPEAIFDRNQATLWLAEGLMMYIPDSAVHAYISRVNALSTQHSTFVFDGVKNREQLLATMPEIPANFMASSANDALNAFNQFGWQVSHTLHYPTIEMAFYTMSKE